MADLPPDRLTVYRVLTGPYDDAFCRRVSDALALGYQLHEGPALAFNGEQVVVAQALVWPSVANYRTDSATAATASARPV